MELFKQLTGRDSLLAIGVTLFMVGIFMRGFARSSQRAIALRKQHWLHTRKPGETDPTAKETGWFDKHLPTIANSVVLAGMAITVFALTQK